MSHLCLISSVNQEWLKSKRSTVPLFYRCDILAARAPPRVGQPARLACKQVRCLTNIDSNSAKFIPISLNRACMPLGRVPWVGGALEVGHVVPCMQASAAGWPTLAFAGVRRHSQSQAFVPQLGLESAVSQNNETSGKQLKLFFLPLYEY